VQVVLFGVDSFEVFRMECLLGIRFNDYVLLAADTVDARSIVVMNHDEEKFCKVSDQVMMAVCGEAGQTDNFSEYIQKNVKLYKMRFTYELSPKSTAHFTRRTMAEYLRSSSAYNCNLIVGGYDKVDNKAQLFFIDYLASISELPYCAHGYGGFFILGTMDAHYKPDLPLEQGIVLLKLCIQEISKRFLVNLPIYKVKCIDKDGIRNLESIKGNELVNYHIERPLGVGGDAMEVAPTRA